MKTLTGQSAKRSKKRKVRKNSVSKSIKAKVVKEIESSSTFARMISLDLNIFMTVRYDDINDVANDEKNKRRERDLNRIKQFARDKGFITAFVWSRESERLTGDNEHLHILLHVPTDLQLNFQNVVKNWPADVHVRRADYKIRKTSSGKIKSAIGYLLKNSPQAARGTSRLYKLGGPICGKRCGCSRNINLQSQIAYSSAKIISADRAVMLRKYSIANGIHV